MGDLPYAWLYNEFNPIELRKFQNLNHPKNPDYDGEINETWDNCFSGTALSK